jgi:hypothetical protein
VCYFYQFFPDVRVVAQILGFSLRYKKTPLRLSTGDVFRLGDNKVVRKITKYELNENVIDRDGISIMLLDQFKLLKDRIQIG